MELLRRHELFEIELLEALHNAGFLQRLAFGGGTMLRLCHEMNRYSTDLDFWLLKRQGWQTYHKRLTAFLEQRFELTDSHQKFFTLLYEIRTPTAPRRLKIEIRRKVPPCEIEDTIAFSTYGTRQVLVKSMTLKNMLKLKIAALLDRGEIRDAFDIEFLLRRGVAFSPSRSILLNMMEVIRRFRPQDYRVTLGSLLEPEARTCYRARGFAYLAERIQALLVSSR